MSEPRPLVVKLAQVMGKVGYIAKSGRNEAQGYAYARESDIVQAIRGELVERNVMVIPDVLEVLTMERTKSDGKPGVPMTRVKVCWHLIDGDSGDEMTVVAFGDGMDSGDKGYYKAMTGCQKYLWMKMFHLPTGDDPEASGKKTEARMEAPETSARRRFKDIAKSALKNQRVLEALRIDRETAESAIRGDLYALSTVLQLALKKKLEGTASLEDLDRAANILADLMSADPVKP